MYGLIDTTEIAERCGPFRGVQRDVSGSARNPARNPVSVHPFARNPVSVHLFARNPVSVHLFARN
ncbi:MAG: hypothetical protein ACXWO3_04730, partial [Isosphaeraceae bacterium]